MKILYLHQYFNTPAMRGGTRSYEMARRFVAAGHEVHIVTSSRSSESAGGWYETQEAGIRIHWLPVPYANAMGFLERIKAFLHFAFAASKKAVAIGGDVVFATSTPLTIAIPGVYASKRLGVPMVFEVRDLWPELPIAIGALKNPVLRVAARRLERFAYNNARQVIALSPGMRDGVVKTGYPAERVHVIPNSSDVDRFRGEGVNGERFLDRHPHLQGEKIVLYAGTLGRINGVGYLVELADAARSMNPALHFVIVGSGMEEDKVRSMAEQAGVLGENLTMLPPLPKSEIPDVLAAATVASSLFVDLPEMWHNSANKFFDALASGTPVMINYQGWQAELIHETGAGIVIPPDNAAEGVRLLSALIADEERYAAAQAAAAALADSQFNRDELANKLLQVLCDTVA